MKKNLKKDSKDFVIESRIKRINGVVIDIKFREYPVYDTSKISYDGRFKSLMKNIAQMIMTFFKPDIFK